MNFNANTQGYAPKKSLGPKKVLILALACAVVVLLIVFFTAFSPIVTIPSGQTGVITLFGRVSEDTYGEGLHAKNPLARVIVMDNRTQKETVTMQAFSSDIQQVDVIATVNFHVPRDACSELYQKVGLGYYEQVMEPRVQEGVKAVFARYSAEKLIGARSTTAHCRPFSSKWMHHSEEKGAISSSGAMCAMRRAASSSGNVLLWRGQAGVV